MERRDGMAWALVLALVLATGARAADAVRIGEFGSLTGTDTAFGNDVHDGIALAIAEANAAGGTLVGGARRPVEVVTADDHSQRADVDAAVKKLVDAGVHV